MTRLRLVIFDVDGTLVDSQGNILAAMEMCYAALGLAAPAPEATRAIVGLSLPEVFATLSPDLPETDRDRLATGYREAFAMLRARNGAAQTAPFFPGARAMLDRLAAEPDTLLAVATGKSRRGMAHLIEGHGLEGMFLSVQTADTHPSKPHPSMIETCLAETGVAARDAVMLGDTTYDMEMARAAGVTPLAVGWGYHPVDRLAPLAAGLLHSWDDLPGHLERLLTEDAR